MSPRRCAWSSRPPAATRHRPRTRRGRSPSVSDPPLDRSVIAFEQTLVLAERALSRCQAPFRISSGDSRADRRPSSPGPALRTTDTKHTCISSGTASYNPERASGLYHFGAGVLFYSNDARRAGLDRPVVVRALVPKLADAVPVDGRDDHSTPWLSLKPRTHLFLLVGSSGCSGPFTAARIA